MSLIHWWPLNGDTKDYGSGNLALIGQGSIGFTSSGKIGKGASFTSDSQNLKATDLSTLHSFTNYTLCCWVYLTARATNHSTAFLSSGDWNVAAKQVTFGLYNYSSGYQYLLVPNGSAWSGSIQLANKIQLNVWHHYAITYDGTTTKGYVDGVYVGQRNGGGISSTNVSYYYLGAATYYAGFTMKGTMNDFRIYNHALSAKEVKEIAKGLVLHYTFEDPWIEPTTNLISSITGSTLLVKSGNGIDVQTASGDAACSLKLSTTTVQGNTYTLSFDVNGMGSSDRCSFGIWFSGGVGQKYITPIYNGHNVIKCTNFPAAVSSLTFDDSGRSNTNIIHIRNFQFEAKDHATPYVVGSRTVGKVYDNSGYGYNGTAFPDGTTGSLPITTDSGSGTYSVYLSYNNTAIQTPDLSTLIHDGNYSIACWFKHTNDWSGRSWETIYGGPSGFEIEMKNSTTNSPLLYAYSWNKGSVAYSLNEWHQFVMTRTTSGTVWYLDGVQAFTGTAGSIPSGDYFIGAWKTNAQQNYRGYVADFKIYATALSADDILAEYQRKAAIDKSGNMFTGEFIEDNSNAKLPTKKNQIITTEFVEGTDKVRIFGDYTQLEYIENISKTTISTGYKLDMDNDSVEITFQATELSQNGMIFASSDAPYFWIYHYNASGKISMYIDNGSGQNNLGGPTKDINKHTATWINKKYYVDDVFYGEQTRSLGTTRSQIILFNYVAGSAYPYIGKIFNCKIWNANGVKRHFIPAKRNRDNAIGMFELTEKKFYASTGTGTFTAGPEIGLMSVISANEIKEN